MSTRIVNGGLIGLIIVMLSGLCLGSDSTTRGWLRYLEENAVELESQEDLSALAEWASGARVVLLGESTHGTVEYYQWRKRISQKLIAEHGFDFIAVEGDWPSSWQLNRYVKGHGESVSEAQEALSHFQRWPRWMWANVWVEQLGQWLKEHNSELDGRGRAGFYGLDVYAMMDSIDAVLEYLDGRELEKAQQAYESLLRYRDNPQDYVRAIAMGASSSERQVGQVVQIAAELEPDRRQCEQAYGAWFNAKINALAVQNGERHYRAMLEQGPASWNRRVEHMKDTLNRLLDYYGPDSKAIVWAHNTHIGDARSTSMTQQGMVNIGQLSRQRYGSDNVAAIGFAKYTGQVRAGSQWGSPGQVMNLPQAMPGSLGAIFNEFGPDSWYVIFDQTPPGPLLRPVGHRAVGVTYNPANERGNYVPSIVPRRYDAMVFFRNTTALDGLFEDDGS